MDNFVFRSKIKNVRKERNMSQKDLANGLCTQGLISKIETGDVIPNAILLKDICVKLTVSIDVILEDDTFHYD